MTDDTITHEALAPCPFCGRTNSELLPEGPTSPSFVRCLCDCEIVGDDESDARTKWNTRAPLTAGSDFDQGYERGYNQGRSDAAADLARAPMTGPEVAAIRAEERKILLRRAASIIIAHEMRGEISDGAGSDLRSAIRALDKETDHE